MNQRRVAAGFLLLIAFLALVARRAFPFLHDIPVALQMVIALAGAACLLVAVRLWFPKPTNPNSDE